MKESRAWYLFYGRTMGMDEQAIMSMYYGEYKDMMACFSVYNGHCIACDDLTHDQIMEMD